ncbi:hypothetical protein [Haloferula rosea]|uniref:DUF1571 domain-containing protein n=1 Tax=Haloferula rosea TaxID=490093 RepID=A0A934RDV8_9BACT|nr:hypothetical protein [Haloferula rosea]MBK1827424.1 hypothetical protein [Haloferula rosea]
MTTRILSAALFLAASIPSLADQAALGQQLTKTYQAWREAVIKRDARQWQALTADYRRREVQNRLVSEKRPFPAAVFELPAPPPSLQGLRIMHLSQKGPTAKVGYFGAVNFGVGGAPTENVLVLSFVSERGRWTYDRADFVNLAALPEVRKELAAGNPRYFKETPECQATGQIPPTPALVPPAKYIAKAYVFCPGREVQLQINRVSRHRFANAKEAEIVLGGAKDGRNEVTFTAKPLEGSTGKEAMAIRVYLMSEIEGVKPIIAYEYLIKEGQPVKGFESGQFNLDPATAAKLVP